MRRIPANPSLNPGIPVLQMAPLTLALRPRTDRCLRARTSSLAMDDINTRWGNLRCIFQHVFCLRTNSDNLLVAASSATVLLRECKSETSKDKNKLSVMYLEFFGPAVVPKGQSLG